LYCTQSISRVWFGMLLRKAPPGPTMPLSRQPSNTVAILYTIQHTTIADFAHSSFFIDENVVHVDHTTVGGTVEHVKPNATSSPIPRASENTTRRRPGGPLLELKAFAAPLRVTAA
jgi:hypothetical protein